MNAIRIPETPKSLPRVICPICERLFPIFNRQGKHNFCPTSWRGEIVSVCMDCRVELLGGHPSVAQKPKVKHPSNPGVNNICQLCDTESPILNAEGKHNFCYASWRNVIINLCIPCKLKVNKVGHDSNHS